MEIQVRSCSESEQEKNRGLMIDLIAYTAAFLAAAVPFSRVDDPLTAVAVFTGVATLLLYIVSVIYKDVSVYDPYWSVAPPLMMLAVMLKYRLWNVNAVILLGLILIWAVRLTANWYATYRGIGHEDWRYANFRKKVPPVPFQVISFFGFHFVPTAAVYGGMTCAVMAAQQEHFALLSAIGAGIMLLAVWLEYVSDRAIHRFLREHGRTSRTCDVSVWKYSRHPNYLGEMLIGTIGLIPLSRYEEMYEETPIVTERIAQLFYPCCRIFSKAPRCPPAQRRTHPFRYRDRSAAGRLQSRAAAGQLL